jgi:pimeloyl-ACP methyl ester carboxylesterase
MCGKAFKSEEGRSRILDSYGKFLDSWPVACEQMYVGTRFGKTFVIASGNETGEPVFLIHGSSTNSAMWMGDAAELGRDFRVYAVDIIGEPGKSDDCRPEMEPRNYAGWISDVMEGLQVEKASFVGNSLGGWMALCIAACNPEKVKKLVLIASSGIWPEKKSFIFKAVFLSILGQKGIDRLNSIVYGGLEMPEEVVSFGRTVMENFNPRMGKLHVFSDEELANLTMPTLYIGGDEDALLRTGKAAERLAAILPCIETDVRKGAGHVVVNCAKEISEFLQRAKNSAGS